MFFEGATCGAYWMPLSQISFEGTTSTLVTSTRERERERDHRLENLLLVTFPEFDKTIIILSLI